MVNSCGRSGGLINIRDPRLFQVTEAIKSRWFWINVGHWDGIQELTIFENMYEPQPPSRKNQTLGRSNGDEEHSFWHMDCIWRL